MDMPSTPAVEQPAEPPSAALLVPERPADFGEIWPFLIVPGIVWIAISVGIINYFTHFTPLFLAIPAGLVLGLLATGLLIMMAVSSNGSTLLEVNITLLIYLVLAAMLAPVFLQARERGRRNSGPTRHLIYASNQSSNHP